MILDYKNVSVYQGERLVLGGVNLSVEEGEMVYLLGAVGSGKTSLLKTVYGALPVEGERADALGHDLIRLRASQQPALRRQLGVVFQDFRLLPGMDVRGNLDFVLRATGWGGRKERERRLRETLRLVRLEDKEDSPVHELSGGEQQRVCIARALLNRPKMIIADEPTGNLDSENGEMILALLDEIRRQEGAAVLMSTHNQLWPTYFPGSMYWCAEGKVRRAESL